MEFRQSSNFIDSEHFSLAFMRFLQIHEVRVRDALDVAVPLAPSSERIVSGVLGVGANHLNQVTGAGASVELCAIRDVRKRKSLPVNSKLLCHIHAINLWLPGQVLVVVTSCRRVEANQQC